MRIRRMLTALVMAAAICFAGCAQPGEEGGEGGGNEPPDTDRITAFDNSSAPLEERLGVTWWGGKYLPGSWTGDSISAACDLVEALGSKVVKLACGDLSKQYPLDDFSGATFNGTADVLKHPYFAAAFARPFKTYYLSAPERRAVNWRDGMNAEEKAYVESEFYEMTKHLLTTYRGTGKTFVLQNWETDNYIGQTNDVTVMRAYANYFNCRQDGINRARDEIVMSKAGDVYVFGALEVNRLGPSDYLRAVDEIVPRTYSDLYTYSSYEAKDAGVVSTAQEVQTKLVSYLQYYRSMLPPAERYPQPVYFGGRRLAITEFGYPDKADGYSGERSRMVAEGHVLAARTMRLQHLVYWQLCCNEAVGENAADINRLRGEALRAYDFEPGDLNGFWLIRPDGEKTYTYRYFEDILRGGDGASAVKPPAWQ